ncbi:antibiotic biosynthesis monooxygenase [Roseomonas gilardii]|uniref:Antibiotic biosynthesis monooxygenase n=1 Tax=Roseomonas gilardii TaxID=257708 RepID=A0ABU3MJ84_9PROT|nr:antibiotic biosynthesis monooxygenase [Roseomonas gilardii]MDT8332877.1 antibiotic biosynthesis monooxygenase [Roseomonas gilardii]
MSEQLYWIFSVEVREGQMAAFKALAAEIVATARNEPGTLSYDYTASENGKTVHIFERYRDSASAISHVQETFTPFAERFMALVKATGFIVYGKPTAEARKVLDGLGASYMTPFDGFTR